MEHQLTIEEIRRIKDYYTTDLYQQVRGEQKIDQSYIDDTFAVPEVKFPHVPVRSGIGYHMVSAPAEQIITSNPQAFIFSDKKGDIDAVNRLAKEINGIWIEQMRRQLPNIFKEVVKNKLARGESYVRVVHNEGWVTEEKQRSGLPILFLAPEPMILFGSPEEDNCGWLPNTGVPNFVITQYERQPLEVIHRYPSWTNPKGKKIMGEHTQENLIDWWEYIDKNIRYSEADGEPVLNGGIQPNIYGFTPYIRKYSGFGKRSPWGWLHELIFSDIRMSRNLIREECAIRSDISSIMHIFAHKPVTIILPDGSEVNDDELRKSLDMGSYALNLLFLPTGAEIKWGDTILPSAEAYQYLRDVRVEINQRHPFIMAGFPFGSSGRQQDMTQTAAMRRYDTVIENTELQFAAAFEMGLAILKKIPGLMPGSIKREDLNVNYHCEVQLRAPDPVEDDRLATLGSRLYAQGEIDLKTNLTKYQKYTQNEAEEIIENILVDRITYQNPDVARLMGMKLAEKAGMLDELRAIQQQNQMEGRQQQALIEASPPSIMQRRIGQVSSPAGREMIDMALANRGQRRPPQRFER